MNRLPVFRSVGEVFSGVTRHYFQLLFVSWPAVLVTVAAGGLIGSMYRSAGYVAAMTANNGKPDLEAMLAAQARLYSGTGGLLLLAAFLVLVLASSVAAVRWHRLVLLGEGAGSASPVRFLRAEDGRYIWTYIKVFLLLAGLVMVFGIVLASLSVLKTRGNVSSQGPLMLIVVPVALFFYFWVLTVYMRASLALPDAAVGMGGRVGAVFKASSGNGVRLVGYVLLIALALMVVTGVAMFGLGVVAAVLAKFDARISLAIGLIAYVGLYMYFLMIGITMLSVAYREIVGLPDAEPDLAAL
ncbi:MAG: hypothetical protein K8R18_15675 [Parvibaculum sp.]|uniref:hypothetical protein n=1 Tax=Parvibaculum sp. TaxID=2024848 RepID=UPI0025D3E67F|nr:hypothetical protein [Parvibaculum sp.]MCE9651058.1 hypothetical protein [Parvibaculum sp.]